jgi:hypothetical protein
MKEKLTILTTTHYKASAHRLDSTYRFDHSRSTTSTSLIESTIEKLYEFLGTRDICHYISLDHDPTDKGSCTYLDNLNKLLVNYPNINLIVTTTGIRQSIINLINAVQTEYFLWFEHDWHFKRDVNLIDLIQLMDNEKHINYIRFNKRQNIVLNCDSQLLEQTFNINDKTIYLCGTDGWSNNPYLGRTDNWKTVWMHYLENNLRKQHITIELELQEEYRRQIAKDSFQSVLQKWGVYIYDRLGAPQTVHHVNGKLL